MITIDVNSWEKDEHNRIFPIGARDKQMLWSPINAPLPLKSSWPYLFKESIKAYSDQFWTEIVAHIISKHLNVRVPLALPAIINIPGIDTPIGGALIEWFYDPQQQRFIHAEEIFNKINPEFDLKTGKHHNFKEMKLIVKAFKQYANLDEEPYDWICDMALFDALIGNTDRHQENWGFIVKSDTTTMMAPLYDNGSSLGHERFTDKIATWNDCQVENYVQKGKHHIRNSREDTSSRIQLIDFVVMIAEENKYNKDRIMSKLQDFDLDLVFTEILTLTEVTHVTPFTVERYNWICRIIECRLNILKEALL